MTHFYKLHKKQDLDSEVYLENKFGKLGFSCPESVYIVRLRYKIVTFLLYCHAIYLFANSGTVDSRFSEIFGQQVILANPYFASWYFAGTFDEGKVLW